MVLGILLALLLSYYQPIAAEAEYGTKAVDVNTQIFEVAARELLVRNDLDLAIGLLRDLDRVAEVSGAAIDFDAVVQELLEGLDVEDLVVDGLRAVDDELQLSVSECSHDLVSRETAAHMENERKGKSRVRYLLRDLLALLAALEAAAAGSWSFLHHVP